MFDIGFSELIVCGIVALVVIGPERLPKVARTLGVLFGRLQRYVAQVKSDINREMELSELSKVKSEFESAARSFQGDVESQAAEVGREMRSAQESIERSLQPTPVAGTGGPTADVDPVQTGAPGTDSSPQLELGIEPPAPSPRPADRAAG